MGAESQDGMSSIGRLVAELDRLAAEAGSVGEPGRARQGPADADAGVSVVAAQLRLAQTWVEPPAGLRACVLCRALLATSEEQGPRGDEPDRRVSPEGEAPLPPAGCDG